MFHLLFADWQRLRTLPGKCKADTALKGEASTSNLTSAELTLLRREAINSEYVSEEVEGSHDDESFSGEGSLVCWMKCALTNDTGRLIALEFPLSITQELTTTRKREQTWVMEKTYTSCANAW